MALRTRQPWFVVLVCLVSLPVVLPTAQIRSSRSGAHVGGMDRETWIVTMFIGGLS